MFLTSDAANRLEPRGHTSLEGVLPVTPPISSPLLCRASFERLECR